jgi:hypothetical protein
VIIFMQEKNTFVFLVFSLIFGGEASRFDAFFTWWPLDGSGEYTHTLCQAVRHVLVFLVEFVART